MHNNHSSATLPLLPSLVRSNELNDLNIWINVNSICGNSKKKSSAAWDYLHGCHEKPDVQHRKGLGSVVGRPSLRSFYIQQHPPGIEQSQNPTKTLKVMFVHSPSFTTFTHLTHTSLQAPLYRLQRNYRVLFRKRHQLWQNQIWLCAKLCGQRQPPVARVAVGIFGHAPVYILRVLRAGTKVTASGRFWFWSWLPLLWRNFCRCLSSWRFFFSCRCCSFLCLLDTWEWRKCLTVISLLLRCVLTYVSRRSTSLLFKSKNAALCPYAMLCRLAILVLKV